MTEITINSELNTLNKVDPNGIIARIMLAFLATAGIFYVNIMPAVVSGLKEGLAFTTQQAGFVSSANLYGADVPFRRTDTRTNDVETGGNGAVTTSSSFE